MAAFFYPSTCHPMGRRSFLAGALGAAGVLGAGLPRVARAGTLEESRRIILARARERQDPWAIVHAVRALGRDLTLAGGQPAVSFVLSEYLEERVVNGATYLAFPLKVEVHENMFLKTFLEAGVSPEFGFAYRGRPRKLHDVIEGARALFRFTDATGPNAIPWSIIALARTTPPPRRSWTNAWGERVELAQAIEAGFRMLEQASKPVEAARDLGTPLERLAPVHDFTCGGTHLLYALLGAAHAGHGGPRHRERLRRQMDILVYRLWADPDLITRFYQPRIATKPELSWFLLDAQVKFIGHAFECLRFAERHAFYAVPAEQAARRRDAGAVLDADIRKLGAMDLAPIRAKLPELYQQLVGDVCHAHHGLTLT